MSVANPDFTALAARLDAHIADTHRRLAAIELAFSVVFMELEERDKVLHETISREILENARVTAEPEKEADLVEAVRKLCDFR